jgi:hypothetical protein
MLRPCRPDVKRPTDHDRRRRHTGRVSKRAPSDERVDYSNVPGWELVSAGLADLAVGRVTVAAMLVKSADTRLRAIGIEVPGDARPDAYLRMYELVEREVGEGPAHGRYNALRRRLLSFLRSAAYAPHG